MKKHQFFTRLAIACIVLSLAVIACKKDGHPTPSRQIQYILYTKENFSGIQDTIRFRLLMSSKRGPILDSALAPMTVSAIPDSLHRLIFNKTVPPGHERDTLLVGFIYDIDNVGESWFLDSSAAGETLKTVEYSFR
jgi:hypothetical protein